MAESTNRVLLKIDFEGSNAIQQTVALRKVFEDLSKERKALLDKVKEGNALSEKERVQLELLNAQLKENQRETRTVTKFIDDSIKTRKAETGSIEANRAKLSQLTAEYIKTGNPTKRMTAEIKTLSDTLKKQESALGDNRRNVGNYAEALGSIRGPIGNAVVGIQGFNTTLKANPIGAVITVLQALYDAFKNNAEIADTISAVFSGVNKAFHFVVDTIKNVVTSFDNLTEAISHPLDFLFNLGKGIADAGKAGYEASRQLDALVVTQQNLNNEIKLNDQQIRSLTFQLKDRTKTEKERIAIAEQIAALEVQNAEKQLLVSQKLLEAEQLKLKNKELSSEEQARLSELETEVFAAESEKQIAQSQKQTRINILLDKEETAAVKEEGKKRVDLVAEASEILRLALEDLDEVRSKQREKEKKEREKKDAAELDAFIIQLEKEEAEYQKSLEIRRKLSEDYANAQLSIEKAKLDGIQALVDIAQAAAGDNAQLQVALLVLEKAASIAEVIFNLQVEKAKNAAVYASIPGGAIVSTALNQAANIRAAISIGTIVGTAIPQFKKAFYEGGYTGDGNPTEQSTNLGTKPYTYHKGEYVVPNKVLATPQGQQYVGILEAMRKSTPGNLAYLGGYADGGFTQRALSENVNQKIQAMELQKAFQNMPTPIVRVSDIERVTGNKERAISVSDL